MFGEFRGRFEGEGEDREFQVGDRVLYDDYNVNRWVRGTIVSQGMKDGRGTYGVELDAGQRPELPEWMDRDGERGHWGYENQFRAL